MNQQTLTSRQVGSVADPLYMVASELDCRFCGTRISTSFADLGMSPAANSYLSADELGRKESFYPLQAFVCHACFLVQLGQYQAPDEIFGDYAYFSSYSESWLRHANAYVEQMIAQFEIDASKQVIEIASNDGYLLQYFKECGVPVLGVEPAVNVARVAQAAGIPTVVKFFGEQSAREMLAEGCSADLLLGNNVLAHVPDLNDFVAGMKLLLKPNGILTMEFPHLLRMMAENQFDTIYQEHFSYFSFITVQEIFAKHGITLFDVEELPSHGGSLRIFGRHSESSAILVEPRVEKLLSKEREARLDTLETYKTFAERVREAKRRILTFLVDAKRAGKTIVGYGAPAKGNTLLNYCGIRSDFLDFTVDISPHKQGLYLPGTHIPILAPEHIREVKPDYVFILPWNLKDEIMGQIAYIREWGGKFVVPIPEVRVFE